MRRPPALPLDARTALAELMQGADVRAQSPYGLSLPASDALLHFGSCTANPLTPAVLARYQAMPAAQRHADPRPVLRALFGAAQCHLAASGTDAEYSCALAMGPEPFVNILMDPAEVGSGCARAAMGLPHAQGGPVRAALPVRASLETPRLRDAQGQALSQAEVDEQVHRIAARHPHEPLLLHHVACSKTGLSAPSEAACLRVQHGHPAGARVVVDASQGRFEVADVRRWLAQGWAVILTGSKYFGAPPFCGATLFPLGWPVVPELASGPGLRARWSLAVQAMSAPAPSRLEWTRALRAHFLPHLDKAWVDAGEHLDRQGILSFDLGFDAAHTLQLHRALIADGFFIGQPVAAGRRTLLRVALGALTPRVRMEEHLAQLARAIQHELAYG